MLSSYHVRFVSYHKNFNKSRKKRACVTAKIPVVMVTYLDAMTYDEILVAMVTYMLRHT